MKNFASFAVAGVIVSGLLSAPSFAGVVIESGSTLSLTIPGIGAADNRTPILGMDTSFATFHGANRAEATYNISDSGFLISDISQARTAANYSIVSGVINFSVTDATNYSFAGLLNFASSFTGGSAAVSASLVNTSDSSVLFNYDSGSIGANSGAVDVAAISNINTQGSANGQLAAGVIYSWVYSVTILNDNSAAGAGSAGGDVSLVFTDVGIPEPASFGMMALAAGGLLMRRRR